MVSRSSESVSVCFGPLLRSPSPCDVSPQNPASMAESVSFHSDRAAGELCYLDLRVSRQEGRYLSNSMVRLAFSDWTSLLSIQLDTGGFQPRSAGLMYRMPGKKNRKYTFSDYNASTHGWINPLYGSLGEKPVVGPL